MADIEKFFPAERNQGKPCVFWTGENLRCTFPKIEIENAPPYTLCDGIVGETCIKLNTPLYNLHILGRLPETAKLSGEISYITGQIRPRKDNELPPAS